MARASAQSVVRACDTIGRVFVRAEGEGTCPVLALCLVVQGCSDV